MEMELVFVATIVSGSTTASIAARTPCLSATSSGTASTTSAAPGELAAVVRDRDVPEHCARVGDVTALLGPLQ